LRLVVLWGFYRHRIASSDAALNGSCAIGCEYIYHIINMLH